MPCGLLLARADEVIEYAGCYYCTLTLLQMLTAESGTGLTTSALQRPRQLEEGTAAVDVNVVERP